MANRTIQFDIKAFADTKGLDEFANELKRLKGEAEPLDRILGEAVNQVNAWAKSQKISADNTALATGAIKALQGAMTAGSATWRSAAADVKAYQGQIKALTSEYDRLAAAETAAARRARKVQAIQEYAGTANPANRSAFQGVPIAERTPQSTRGPSGTFVAPPGFGGAYGTNFNQYAAPIGPVDIRGQLAAKEAADAQLRNAHQRHRQQLLQIDEKFNQLEIQKDNEAHKKMLAQQEAAFRADLADFDRRLEARDRRRNRRQGGRPFGAFGQSAGAIAAGGFFGGPEGIVGAIAGTALGGPGGALAGATAGASVGAFRQQLGGIAQYTSQLNLAKVTLAQVSTGLDDYTKKLEFARTVSGNYAVDLETSIRGYARITAAAQANNLSLSDTQAIYKGLIATGVAFGASQEDLQAIVTATVQVLSKGKLSAEELSGQLGERIPGAVAAFAQATGRSLPELAAALKKGEVSIADFVKFAKAQVDKYDEIAQGIGASPEKAGARLKLALDTAAENYGGFLQQIGAGFQDNMTKVIAWFNENEVVVKNWVTLFYNGATRIAQILDALIKNAIKSYQIAADIMSRTPGGIIGGIIGNVAERVGIGRPGGALPDWINQGGKTPDQLFPQFKPSTGMFSVSNGAANNLGKPAEEAGDDAAARKAANEAAAKERLAMQLYNDQLRLEERLAQNRIKLEDTVFRHRMDLMRQAADNQQELDDKRMQNLLGRMTGDTSGAAAVVDLVRGLQELDRRKVDAQNGILQAQRDLTSNRQQQAATARTESLLRSDDGGGGGSIIGGRAFRGGARTGFTRDRDAEQSGYDVVLPGGVGAPIPNPVSGLRITGTGFQGSGRGSSGRGYGRYVTGRFTGQDGKQYELLIGHLDKLIARVGDVLERGAIIGNQGETGRTFGTHATTHVNALNGGDPWRVLRSEIVQPWIRGWSGGGGGTTRTLPNGKATRIPGLASAAGRNVSDDGSVMTSEAEVTQQRELLRLETERARLLRPEIVAEFTNKISGGLREQQKALEESNAEFQLRNRLTMEGMRPDQIDFEVNKARIFRDSNEVVSQANEVLEQLKDRISPEVYKEAKDAIEQLGQGYQKLASDTEAAYKAQNAPGVKLDRRRGELRQALGELGSAENAIISLSDSVENGLSNGFSSAVTNIVSGTGTIKDAIANMLQSIAQEFLNYAAKILAKQAVLGILGLFGRGLGGALGGGAGGFASVFAGGSDFSAGFGMAGSLLNANGNAFANGIRPFATGGVVDRPTLFKFANGGAMNTGVMGEAGPEAILPLRRGPNGKLGVQAAPAAPIDVRVETTVINGVEYATVDQLRQATKEAAVRGRNMAFSGIQQSTKVRRRLGM